MRLWSSNEYVNMFLFSILYHQMFYVCACRFQKKLAFNTGPFNVDGEEFNDLLWKFGVIRPWRLIQGIDNVIIRKLAPKAQEYSSLTIDIRQLKTFHRQHRDLQSHQRNKLGAVTQDKVPEHKYNSKQLRKFGLE